MKWYRIDDSAERVTIDIYGDIGDGWDEDSTSAKELLDAVRDAKGKPIDLHINSGGGNVFDAYAMMTALAAHDAPVTAYVDGLAASAASFLCAAADEVVIADVGWMMIHDASAIAFGNAAELRETAAWLAKVDDQIAGIYARRAEKAGLDLAKDEYASAMHATTWYTAQEAVEFGLADRIDDTVAAIAAHTDDTATNETMPEVLRATMATTGDDTPDEADGTDAQERVPEPVPEDSAPEPQERQAVVMNGKIYTIGEME